MFSDWAFARNEFGVLVIQPNNVVTLVEFNEFLRRIASGDVQAEDEILSSFYTNGQRQRAGDLRIFGMVRSGEARTENMLPHTPTGILAEGEKARALLRAWEGVRDRNAETLLRPASAPEIETDDLLRAASSPDPVLPPEELLRAADAME